MTDAPHPRLDELIAVLARLRAPGGCAWDREQTHESLVQYLLEETYELVEAIESGSRDDLVEELGDVLYQVIFHADIAAHATDRSFDIEDVAERMTAKMVGRHPHVFAESTAETAADVVALWEDVKAVEKPGRTSVLDGIPLAMPSLLLAAKLVGRAERVGVAPATPTPPVSESVASPESEEALGSLLLSIVADARSAGLDPERALRGALRDLRTDIRAAESPAQR
ncbi:YabN family protein [Marisediminicola sp. LYQ134]|uniref:nucleoside triphosphate pyrophosphohydrolase n=1 Tax=unclassified Marisediminicola TaxID=2618316 RepID=UPI003982E550